MSEMYCIISDQSGHRWICPVDKKEKVVANIQAIEDYWSNADYEKDCPDDLTEEYNLTHWEGGDLTFSNPQIDGKEIE